jgi:hypothetical protein
MPRGDPRLGYVPMATRRHLRGRVRPFLDWLDDRASPAASIAVASAFMLAVLATGVGAAALAARLGGPAPTVPQRVGDCLRRAGLDVEPSRGADPAVETLRVAWPSGTTATVRFVDPRDAEQQASEAQDIGAAATAVGGVLVLASPQATAAELRTATACAALTTQGWPGS